MAEPIIRTRDLRKTYHLGEVDVHALRGVSLEVPKGEFLAVVGPSGSGKSTLFHILGGLTQPTSGSVVVDGEDLAQLGDSGRTLLRRNKVGFVFQRYNLLPDADCHGQYRDRARHRPPHGAAGPELPGAAEAAEASMRRLASQAARAVRRRATAGGHRPRPGEPPAILLADEPTGNLDTENATAVLDVLRDLNERLGQTILMITHNPEAAAYAHRIAHMRDGRILDN